MATGQTQRPRLLQRRDELQRLPGVIQSAAGNRGQLAVVRGQPGIGKSCLLTAAGDQHGGEHDRPDGQARPLERDFPFGVALPLFEPIIAAAPPVQREAWFAGAAGLARPLFAHRPDMSFPAADVADSSFCLLHGLYWLAATIAGRRGLLLAVDDAHWPTGHRGAPCSSWRSGSTSSPSPCWSRPGWASPAPRQSAHGAASHRESREGRRRAPP